MAIDDTSKFAGIIGGLSKQQTVLEQNISPDDALGTTDVSVSEKVVISGTITLNARTIKGVYVVGNPVYGRIGEFSESNGLMIRLDLTQNPT